MQEVGWQEGVIQSVANFMFQNRRQVRINMLQSIQTFKQRHGTLFDTSKDTATVACNAIQLLSSRIEASFSKPANVTFIPTYLSSSLTSNKITSIAQTDLISLATYCRQEQRTTL